MVEMCLRVGGGGGGGMAGGIQFDFDKPKLLYLQYIF